MRIRGICSLCHKEKRNLVLYQGSYICKQCLTEIKTNEKLNTTANNFHQKKVQFKSNTNLPDSNMLSINQTITSKKVYQTVQNKQSTITNSPSVNNSDSQKFAHQNNSSISKSEYDFLGTLLTVAICFITFFILHKIIYWDSIHEWLAKFQCYSEINLDSTGILKPILLIFFSILGFTLELFSRIIFDVPFREFYENDNGTVTISILTSDICTAILIIVGIVIFAIGLMLSKFHYFVPILTLIYLFLLGISLPQALEADELMIPDLRQAIGFSLATLVSYMVYSLASDYSVSKLILTFYPNYFTKDKNESLPRFVYDTLNFIQPLVKMYIPVLWIIGLILGTILLVIIALTVLVSVISFFGALIVIALLLMQKY